MFDAAVVLQFGQQEQGLDQPQNTAKLGVLSRRLQSAGMAVSTSNTSPATMNPPGLLITLVQDLLACQNKDPKVAYKEPGKLQELFQAMHHCNGLNTGHNFKARHVHQVAQLVGSLLLALAGHSQLSFEDVDQGKCTMQVTRQQLLLQQAVAKHMPDLLSILLRCPEDSTVATALRSLAAGLGVFKAEGEFEQALAVLPNIGAFMQHLLPLINNMLANITLSEGPSAKLAVCCDLVTLAIRTFKAAIEVCMRESGSQQDMCLSLARDYQSMSQVSFLIQWQSLLFPSYMQQSHITAMLASLLEIEAVWHIAVDPVANAAKTFPMLQSLLTDRSSLCQGLHHFLANHPPKGKSVTSCLDLLVLVKQCVKAATLVKANEAEVKDFLLMPVKGNNKWESKCMLEVLWLLLTLHKPLLCTACRITEVYSLCLQQSTEWPTVSAYLLSAKRMALPDRVTQHLQNVVQCEQPAEKGSAEWHLGTERTAIMLNLARILLDSEIKKLSKPKKLQLQQLYKQLVPAKPLWDGIAIEHRPAVTPDAVDIGDEAPSSWNGPHLQADLSRQSQHKAALGMQTPADKPSEQSSEPGSKTHRTQQTVPKANTASSAGAQARADLKAKIAETKRKIDALKESRTAGKRSKHRAGSGDATQHDLSQEHLPAATANLPTSAASSYKQAPCNAPDPDQCTSSAAAAASPVPCDAAAALSLVPNNAVAAPSQASCNAEHSQAKLTEASSQGHCIATLSKGPDDAKDAISMPINPPSVAVSPAAVQATSFPSHNPGFADLPATHSPQDQQPEPVQPGAVLRDHSRHQQSQMHDDNNMRSSKIETLSSRKGSLVTRQLVDRANMMEDPKLSHARLAMEISQQNIDAIKTSAPDILLDSQNYNPPPTSGTSQHADTPQQSIQQAISAAPLQHDSMDRSWYQHHADSNACHQDVSLSTQPDTAVPMDIDSGASCVPCFYPLLPVQPPVHQPPVPQPPVHQPPVHRPPFHQPPVHQPPVHRPPFHQPPVHQPPVHRPPFHQPPVHRPPFHQPPVHQPPVHQSPVHQPPVHQPPVCQQPCIPPLFEVAQGPFGQVPPPAFGRGSSQSRLCHTPNSPAQCNIMCAQHTVPPAQSTWSGEDDLMDLDQTC